MASIKRTSHTRAFTRQLQEFLHECTGSAPCEEADRVRDALALLGGSGVDGAGKLDRARLKAMLECGAATSAALELLGSDACLMVSRGASDACLATVVFPGGEEVAASGATLALALLCAHVSAVLTRIAGTAHVVEASAAATSLRLH